MFIRKRLGLINNIGSNFSKEVLLSDINYLKREFETSDNIKEIINKIFFSDSPLNRYNEVKSLTELFACCIVLSKVLSDTNDYKQFMNNFAIYYETSGNEFIIPKSWHIEEIDSKAICSLIAEYMRIREKYKDATNLLNIINTNAITELNNDKEAFSHYEVFAVTNWSVENRDKYQIKDAINMYSIKVYKETILCAIQRFIYSSNQIRNVDISFLHRILINDKPLQYLLQLIGGSDSVIINEKMWCLLLNKKFEGI